MISIVIAYLCKQLIQTSREMCSAYLSKKMSCIQCLSTNIKRHAISMFKIFIVLFLACNVLVLTPNYKIVSEKRLLSSDKDYQLKCNSCGSYCFYVYFQFWQIIYIHNVCPTTMNKTRRCCLTLTRGRRGRELIIVGFTTKYAIGAYHHWCCGFDSHSGQGL